MDMNKIKAGLTSGMDWLKESKRGAKHVSEVFEDCQREVIGAVQVYLDQEAAKGKDEVLAKVEALTEKVEALTEALKPSKPRNKGGEGNE